MIGHRISAGKKRLVAKWLKLFKRVDHMLCYTREQVRYAADYLGVPEARMHRIDFHVDADFYTPAPDGRGNGIVSVGRELRDYPTLFEAVADTDIPVTVVASSPWSRRADQTRNREIPANVTLKTGLSYGELRDLYRNCAAVVVPLQNVDSPAGVTSILEAQAVGKPVIVSATPGIADSIEPGVTAKTVPCGDPAALRKAIQEILGDDAERERLGQAGREAVLAGKTLDHYVSRICAICR